MGPKRARSASPMDLDLPQRDPKTPRLVAQEPSSRPSTPKESDGESSSDSGGLNESQIVASNPLLEWYNRAVGAGANCVPPIDSTGVLAAMKRIKLRNKQEGTEVDWANVPSIVQQISMASSPALPASPSAQGSPDLGKRAQNLGFDGQRAQIVGRWKFQATVGKGGQGHAGLWVRVNQAEQIMERMIVKENWRSQGEWEHALYWHDFQNLIPLEVHMQRLLANCPGSWPVAGFRGFGVYPDRMLFRIYMPFYPHGDLQDLIKSHRQLESERTAAGDARSPLIPERIIWAVFESLAAAACLMEEGVPVGVDMSESWKSIVHRDIKPNNVFFDSPDEEKWQRIPVPILGDFGLAIFEQSTRSCNNPEDLVGTGTPGYFAPEQMDPQDVDPNQTSYPLSSATNVYTIGKTVLAAMSLENSEDAGYERVPIPRRVTQFYSWTLRDLVKQCLAPIPDNRISYDDLVLAIRDMVMRMSDGVYATPMKFQA